MGLCVGVGLFIPVEKGDVARVVYVCHLIRGQRRRDGEMKWIGRCSKDDGK